MASENGPWSVAPRVLVVEDDPGVRSPLLALFRLRGADVSGAASTVEALLLLQSERFDVLISDAKLGGAGDGLWLLEHAGSAWPAMRCYLMSGEPQATHLPFLLKPFSPSEVDVILETARSSRASRDE